MSRTRRNIGLIIILSAIQVSSQHQNPISLLLNIVEQYNPRVIYLTPRVEPVKGTKFVDQLVTDQEKNEFDDLLTEEDGLNDDKTLDENAMEQAKNLLYVFLRTSPENQEPENSSIEETKQVFRQALRARCKKTMSCVTKCTVNVEPCKSKCQKVYDKLDLCSPPKPPACKKSRCGKTMPPKWLL